MGKKQGNCDRRDISCDGFLGISEEIRRFAGACHGHESFMGGSLFYVLKSSLRSREMKDALSTIFHLQSFHKFFLSI